MRDAPIHHEMTRRLLEEIDTGTYPPGAEVRIPAAHYTDEARLDLERRHVFAQHPVIVAHASELPEPGSCKPVELTGVSAILVRDREGEVRAFLNACRHRATRLVDAPCQLKSFVCPYHKWSYKLTGELKGLPHPEAFTTDHADLALVPLPVAERHGFIWLTSKSNATMDLGEYLGPIDAELAALGLGDHVVHECFTSDHAANWKLIIDAFLEAYHIKTLHRDTLAQFFMDARALVDPVGPHFRAVTARKTLLAARELPPEEWPPLRDLVTPSYMLFPNATIIAHPDYVSLVTAYPLATDRLRWVHWMLIPERAKNEVEQEHWDRTMGLIEQTVFQAEDLHVAELMQAGLKTGANRDMLFGQLEQAVPKFHANLQAAINRGTS